MLGRPLLRTSYRQDISMLPTAFQRGAMAALLFFIVLMVLGVPGFDALPKMLLGNTWLKPVTVILPIAVAALGFNILVGLTGQVSLGHAFFMGVGAYTAVSLGGEGEGGIAACVPKASDLGLVDAGSQCGLGLPIWIWLPAAGLVAALIGVIVSPAAVKVRGLYLALATLGLVFIGLHLGRMFPQYAGNFESGRNWPSLDLRLWKEETPLVQMTEDGKWFGFLEVSAEQKQFLFLLVLLIFFTVLAKNIARSRTGRALQAIRDRDVAAEVMGVKEFRYKLTAFAVSSFYAGIGGALYGAYVERVTPDHWSLFLSVDFIAILLVGGAGTIVGTMLGSVFVELIPDLVESLTEKMAEQTEKVVSIGLNPLSWLDAAFTGIANLLITTGEAGDFGPISIASTAPGWPMGVFQWNRVIYGVLIVIFLIFEPLGLFGIWLRVKNYWKRWPFSY